MLEDWIARQTDDDQRLEPTDALASFWEIVSSASDAQIQDLLTQLMDDPYSTLVSVPLYDSGATELLVRIVDRLNPDPDQSDMLENRFPLTWTISVMDAGAFDVRVLLNGAVLVRSRHRVLGPSLWEGHSLPSDPELIQTLTQDLATLRSRNTDGNPTCFLLTHDARGARLLAPDEPVDIGALGWGQLIGVCAFESEDFDDISVIQTPLLRAVASEARSGIVFLRFFGDRIDIIPATRLDDDLDIFLEELSFASLCDDISSGIIIGKPVTGDDLLKSIIERTANETFHISDIGPGATWLKRRAINALSRRLAASMNWSTVNFGLGTHANGPRRAVSLPLGVEEAIGENISLMRRSITLQITSAQESTRDRVRNQSLSNLVEEILEEICGEPVNVKLEGQFHHDLMADDARPNLLSEADLSSELEVALATISMQAEQDEEDLDDAIINASLGVVVLIDFPETRPPDLSIAGMAKSLSGSLEETVSLFLNGRGEYISYCDGDVDSGDHELFRLDDHGDDDDYDADDDF